MTRRHLTDEARGPAPGYSTWRPRWAPSLVGECLRLIIRDIADDARPKRVEVAERLPERSGKVAPSQRRPHRQAAEPAESSSLTTDCSGIRNL